MARKTREDYRLKETEKLYDAVKRTNTHVKDYSMQHLITVVWEPHNQYQRTRIVELSVGGERWRGHGKEILDPVNRLIKDDKDDPSLLVAKLWIESWPGGKEMLIDTTGVNQECLRDHVAKLTIGKNTAIVDLEELLKATRYA